MTTSEINICGKCGHFSEDLVFDFNLIGFCKKYKITVAKNHKMEDDKCWKPSNE